MTWSLERAGGALLALAWLMCADPAIGVAAPPNKVVHALRVERGPRIDGKLDDEVWRRARFVEDFLQKQPTFAASPTRHTRVALAYDAQALYVGARMGARGPRDIQTVMTRRDVTGSAERMIVSFDTFLDRRTAYSFAVTAAGVRADWFHPDNSEFSRDSSYNPVWDAEVTVDAEGWSAEMRIPFTQLRFPRGAEQRWGINFNRYIPQRNEDIFWIPVPKDETAWSSYFGELRGLSGIRQPTRIELLPYVTADMTLLGQALAQSSGDPRFSTGIRAGGNLTMGLGPNMIFNAAVLPDFGQVEADPAEVNLSGFETFFAERRPFFTDGAQLLDGSGPNFYYSRRIGSNNTPILGAAKLTGRLPSRLSIGALAAVTGETSTVDGDTGASVPTAPLAGYGTVRLQQELGTDASFVAASLTGVSRALSADSPLADSILRDSIAGGVEWQLRFDRATYEVEGAFGFTRVSGEPAAIENLARNPVHLFQRPDQAHVVIDPTARSMFGLAGELEVEKRQGNWLWEVESGFESPGFDPNQVGSLRSADDIFLFVGGRYRQPLRGRYLHTWDIGVGTVAEWNFGGARDPGYHFINGSVQSRGFWSLNGQVAVISPGMNDFATRGGPLMGTGWGQESSVSLSSPFAGRYRWSASLNQFRNQVGATGLSLQSSATLQPLDRLNISLTPSYSRVTDNRQYVTTVTPDEPVPASGPFDDPSSYIFGAIERRQLSLRVRAQVAITPNLVVDTYLEPFAASGRYLSFGELAAPGSRQLAPWPTAEADDFTVLSLRSTAVMRWEFVPGSTIFLVWQQNRRDNDADAANVFSGLGESFAIPGGTTLAIKISHWLDANRARSLWPGSW